MIRMRKDKDGSVDVTVDVKKTCEDGTLSGGTAALEEMIKDGLDRCAKNIDGFDEVVIRKDGSMTCKNLPSEPAPEVD